MRYYTHRRLGLLTLLAFLFLASGAQASRVALVVGVGTYDNTASLENPPNDARAMAKVLDAAGFEIILSIDADHAQLGRDLVSFYEKARGAEAALFYFAGHGMQIDGKNYLLSRSAEVADAFLINQDGYDLNDIMSAVYGSGAKMAIAIIDACRNNPLANTLVKKTRAAGRSTAGLSRGLAPIDLNAPNSLVVFATAPGNLALDGMGEANSPFTTALLNHLPTPELEISVMLKRVTAEVRARTEEEQRPEVVTSMAREFYFHETADGLLNAALELPAGTYQTGALEEIVTEYPGSPAARKARNLLQAFTLAIAPARPEQKVLDADPRALPEVQIKAVQRELQRLGLYAGEVDGAWGSEAQTALMEVQKHLGTQPTGAAGDGVELLNLISLMADPPECFVSFTVFPGKLREEPGVLSAKLSNVPMSEKYRVLEQKDVLGTFWFKIQSEDRFGWVMDFNFLRTDGEECRR
jgi:peptidoglycan hydrolase-like protein with peptidoglycan-binding domain